MIQVKISDYVNGVNDGDGYKPLKSEMDRLDSLKSNWSILIDVNWDMNGRWETFVKENRYDHDYEYLESINVADGVNDFKSSAGCLLDKEGRLIFAPKMKRCTSILIENGIRGVANVNAYWWGKVQSKPIRTNIEQFIKNSNYNSQHKVYFENLLMFYKENIYETIFKILVDSEIYNTKNGLDIIEAKDILLERIILSDEIKYKEYGLQKNYRRILEAEAQADMEYPYDDKPYGTNEDERNAKDIYDDFTALVYGEYDWKQKTITLYVEAMKKTRKTGNNLEDLFLSVLLHEFFHAVHYTYCIAKGQIEPFKVKNDMIIESLASVFEHHICKNILRNRSLALDLEKSWREHSVFVYPYSGAELILPRNERFDVRDEFEKLRKVIPSYSREYGYYFRELFEESRHHRVIESRLLHFRSLFLVSLLSMEQAQMELISKYIENRFQLNLF